jgi:peptidoglycan/xylan/chitin deacetylase (PgdA/CDA1 family)
MIRTDLNKPEKYKATARLVKLLFSLVYYVAASLQRKVQQSLGTELAGSCVVLCYHAVPGRQRAQFARQMDVLCRYVKPLRADVGTPLPAGKRYAAVTFDDAYQSVLQNALPELQTRNIPCAVFVVTHLLGELAPWGGSGGFSSDDRFITFEQLRGLSNNLVIVGSHTMTHPHLPTVSEDTARYELTESRRFLETVLNREVRLFAFPHGAFNIPLIRYCQEAGYERVFSIERRIAFNGANEYVTGRVSTDPSDWDLEFRLKLLGAYCWVPTILEIKRKAFSRMARFRSSSYHVTS